MAIISTMNGYSLVGTPFLEIVAIAKRAAIAIIIKSKIRLSPWAPEVTAPIMLNAGIHRRKSKMEGLSMFMFSGLLFLSLTYASIVHVNVKIFMVGNRNISENGV